jgi:hypothetical protein
MNWTAKTCDLLNMKPNGITHPQCSDILLAGSANHTCEISSSHGGEYDVQSCLLGYTAV